MTGQLRRDWLLDWPTYAQRHDLVRHGLGPERRLRCDIHGGERDSLTVSIGTGSWQCKACGVAGGDVLAHYGAKYGFSFIEAARALGAWVEFDDVDRPQRPPTMASEGLVAAISTSDRADALTRARKAAQAPLTPAGLTIEIAGRGACA